MRIVLGYLNALNPVEYWSSLFGFVCLKLSTTFLDFHNLAPCMVLIRALTYHISPSRKKSVDYLIDQLLEDSERFKKIERFSKSKIWTKRAVFPQLNFKREDLLKVSERIEESLSDSGIDYAVIPLGKQDPEKIADQLSTSLSETSRIFYNIKAGNLRDDPCGLNLLPMADLIKKIYEKAGSEACTRFAIAYGGPPETPYFPASISIRRGVSACLRYAGSLHDKLLSSNGESLGEILLSLFYPVVQDIRLACLDQGFEFIGIDASLSPWMEESAARIIETISGATFGMPGTLNAIHKLNISISGLSKYFRTTGFNEVMLPLAEDNRLKELGASGSISAMDLVSMISVSVAGLDMVILSSSVREKDLAELFRDAMVLAFRKRKPIGIRIILANASPCEWINLGRFPKAPVICLS